MRKFLAVVLAVALILPASLNGATGTLAPFPLHQWFTNAGAPAASHRLFTYTAGTTTKLSVYTDSALSVAHSNPITLNSAGRPTSGIYLTPGLSYKFVLAPAGSDDPPSSPLWTQDNIEAIPVGSTASNADVTGTAGETLAAGEAVFLSDGTGGNTSGRWYLTDADNTHESNLAQNVGFATEAITTGNSGAIRVAGRITGLTGLTAGTSYFASATAGALTSTAPTNSRFLGRADSTTTLVVSQSLPDATSTTSGQVSIGTQTIAGAKTFSGVATFSSAPVFSALPTGSGVPVFVRTTSDFTKNANVTLGDVTGMVFPVAANETWVFFYVLKGVTLAAADWRFAVTFPAAPTAVMYGGGTYNGELNPGANATATGGAAIGFGGGGAEELITINGVIRNGANAGNVQLQMAQWTSDASNTIVRAESYVIAERVSP